VLNLLVGASLVLCVMTVTSWVRSYWIAEQVSHLHSHKLPDGAVGQRSVALGVSRGGLGFAAITRRVPPEFLRDIGFNPDGFYSWPLKYWSPG
jgi:hypothetical protein